MVQVSADFTTKTKSLIPYPVSGCISTYGNSIAKSQAQRDALGKLKLGLYRIPLQWNNGNPVSSAGGGPHDISADLFVNAVIAFGSEPMIVLGGTSDNNFTPTDAANMVTHYKGKVHYYVLGNEPNNGGMSIETYCTLFNKCADAMRAVDSSIHIGGPTWSYYDSGKMQTFINTCGTKADIVDFHHYAMGSPPAKSDADTLGATGDWGNEVAAVYKMLAGKTGKEVQVGEFNWAWQYNDGVSGGDKRFFTAMCTAWAASVVGHILTAGGRALQYSDQNGPLGLTAEPGGTNPDNRPGNTPLPIYHGLGAFTGESLFPGVPFTGGTLYSATSDDSNVEAYAVSPGNIVVINKSSSTKNVTLSTKGALVAQVWQTDPSNPYNAPTSKGASSTLTLPGYAVATVLCTATVTPTPTPTPVPVPTPAPTPTPTPTPVPIHPAWPGRNLKRGMSGTDVATYKARLRTLGYSLGNDNIFGTGTDAAVRDLQKKKKLKIDGIVGTLTWSAAWS